MKAKTNKTLQLTKIKLAVLTALALSSMQAVAAIPEGTATGLDSIAIGVNSIATSQNAIAIGEEAEANGTSSIAIGGNGRIFSAVAASTSNSILIAPNGLSTANNSVNIGYLGLNYSGNSVNLGSMSFVDINAGAAVAIGSESVARSSSAVVIGFRAQTGTAAGDGVSIGDSSNVTGLHGVAVGGLSRTSATSGVAVGYGANSSGNNAVAVGNSTVSSGSGSVALGNNSSSSNNGTLALGQNSTASGTQSIALGVAANTTNTSSIAIGTGASSTGSSSVAIGQNSIDGAVANVVSFGNASLKRRLINIGDGTLSTTSTDAVNGRQLNTTNTNVTTAQNTANTAITTANAANTTANAANTTANAADTKATQALSDASAALTAANQADAKAENALNLIGIVEAKADNAIVLAEGAEDSAQFAITRTNQIEDSLRGIGSDNAYADIGVQYSDGTTQTTAGVNVTNELGNRSGLTVGTTSTMISGGYDIQNQMLINDSGFNFSNVISGEAVTLSGVANGVSQFDAVNFGQLSAVDTKADNAVTTANSAMVTATAAQTTANSALTETQRIESTLRGNGMDGAVARMGVQYSNGTSETTAEVLVTNSLGNTHGLSVGTTQTTLSGGANSSVLTLDDTGATFSRQSDGAPVRVQGVAAGVNDNDAVNVRQLNDAIASVGGGGIGGSVPASEISRLESRMDRQDRKIDKVARKSYGGVALAMAMQPTIANPDSKVNLSVGSGYYSGETALAASVAIRTETAIVSFGAGFTTAGDFGARAAITWAWDPVLSE